MLNLTKVIIWLTVPMLMATSWQIFNVFRNERNEATRAFHALQSECVYNLARVGANEFYLERTRAGRYRTARVLEGLYSLSSSVMQSVISRVGTRGFAGKDQDYYELVEISYTVDALQDRIVSREQLKMALETNIGSGDRFADLAVVDAALLRDLVELQQRLQRFLVVLKRDYGARYRLPPVAVTLPGATPFVP